MSTPRRYSESEIAAILKQAAQDQEQAEAIAHHDGLTLPEIQEAAQAAGIAPEFVERAATAADAAALTPPPRVALGQTISVAHTVALPGPFTDDDWDVLVQDLRHTFNAHGKVSARRWSNGNLRVYVESTPDGGHRLHFRTRNAVLQQWLAGGLGIALMGVFFTAVLLIGGAELVLALGAGGLIGLIAAGLYGAGAYALPSWRRERKRQMEAIARRALDRAAERGSEAATSSSAAASEEESALSFDDLPDQEAEASGPATGPRAERESG